MQDAWRTAKTWAYLAVYVVPLLVMAGLRIGGAATFLTPAFTFVLIPLFDLIVGEDQTNTTPDEDRVMDGERYYRIVTWLFVPVYWTVLVMGLRASAAGGWTTLEAVGNVVSLGILGGIGIVVAHEMGHKAGRFEKFLAKALLHPVFYGHFTREHNLGHHLLVATPEDPSSARLGESFYRFYPRAVSGAFRKAMELEAERLQRDGRGAWNVRNETYRNVLIPAALLGAAFLSWGGRAAATLAVSGVIGFSLLEIVNFLEHYGLERRRLENGKYERVTPLHSWNSNHLVTNCFLFHLQRHSDHHTWPARRYQTLRDVPDAPQLPTGYAGMILMAAVPLLWFRVMDRRVADFMRRQRETQPVEGTGVTG